MRIEYQRDLAIRDLIKMLSPSQHSDFIYKMAAQAVARKMQQAFKKTPQGLTGKHVVKQLYKGGLYKHSAVKTALRSLLEGDEMKERLKKEHLEHRTVVAVSTNVNVDIRIPQPDLPRPLTEEDTIFEDYGVLYQAKEIAEKSLADINTMFGMSSAEVAKKEKFIESLNELFVMDIKSIAKTGMNT